MPDVTIIPVDSKFSTTLNVQLDQVGQAAAMVEAFGAAHDAKGGLDFAKALQVAKDHPRFAVIKTFHQETDSKTQQVWVSIDQLQNLMKMVEGAATEDWAMFGAAAKAFLDLNKQKNGSYFTIFSETSSRISYGYNMFQVTQTKSLMSGQLSSVDIEMETDEANVLALVAGSSTTVQMRFKSMVVVEALQAS